MPDFVRLGERFAADCVWFQRLTNFGSYDQATYQDLDVCHPDHPEHRDFLAVLHNPALNSKQVDAHMFQFLVPELSLKAPHWADVFNLE